MSEQVNKSIGFLGFPARDRVTGFRGVVTTISFDLYGCVQVVLQPEVDDKGAVPEGRWYDINRVVTEGERKMSPPEVWTDEKGPAEKPAR